MGTGGKREEIDGTIMAWERDLERVRVALAQSPEPVHARYHPGFMELYRAKEVVKSRWEEIRGVYRPDPPAVKRFEEALAGMEAAWRAARPMLDDILKPMAA